MTHPPSEPFSVPIHARWPDIDQNGHMRTVAYLEVAEDSRMQFFASLGLSMSDFLAQGVGPVVLSDRLDYRRELRLLDRAEVRLELAGLSEDGSAFRLRNTIVRPDGALCTTITSEIIWLDLKARRPRVPPPSIAEKVELMPRAADFEVLPSRVAPS